MKRCLSCNSDMTKVIYYYLPGHKCPDPGCAAFTGLAANKYAAMWPAEDLEAYTGFYLCWLVKKVWSRYAKS